ncbi:MAG TPA: hypothetical protein VFD22_12370 [Gemmatimonadaceae bacterium]|nr:hypothetical protein [Gemmatimonadaceae bacterium]
MHPALRTLAFTAGVISIAACSNDKLATKDVLAEDSTLALDVMSARGDSITIQPPDTTTPPAADTPIAIASAPATTSAPSTSIALSTVPAQPEPKLHVQSRAKRTARRSSSTRTTRIARTQSSKATSRVAAVAATKPTATGINETRPLKASAMLPAGTELSLAADQRVCASMARVGDTFATRIASDVIGPIGVVIPKGTTALAQIASNDKNLGVDMKSISFAGHTYVVTSDVTYTELEKVRRKTSVSKSKVAGGAAIGGVTGAVLGGNPATTVLGAAAGGLAGAAIGGPKAYEDRCVPDGGRIDIKLTEPLKLALQD